MVVSVLNEIWLQPAAVKPRVAAGVRL